MDDNRITKTHMISRYRGIDTSLICHGHHNSGISLRYVVIHGKVTSTGQSVVVVLCARWEWHELKSNREKERVIPPLLETQLLFCVLCIPLCRSDCLYLFYDRCLPVSVLNSVFADVLNSPKSPTVALSLSYKYVKSHPLLRVIHKKVTPNNKMVKECVAIF